RTPATYTSNSSGTCGGRSTRERSVTFIECPSRAPEALAALLGVSCRSRDGRGRCCRERRLHARVRALAECAADQHGVLPDSRVHGRDLRARRDGARHLHLEVPKPRLGGKTDAIPGKTNHTWFKANRPGTYIGQCAEFCGTFHEAMRARVIATTASEYESYVSSTARKDLGHSEFQGVCATCHGMQGQGAYGPNVSANPLLVQPSGIAPIVRNGFGKMPPVGEGWSDAQIKALVQYAKAKIFKGAAASGG